MSIVPTFELDDEMQEWYSKQFGEGSYMKLIKDSSKLKKLILFQFASGLIKVSVAMAASISFGNGKQILLPHYYENKDRVKNIEIREDDVWIFGFPRSGTTVTQEMVWLLDNNLDFETAKKVKLNYRSVFTDFGYFTPKNGLKELRAKLAEESYDYFDEELKLNRPSPRHFKTHLLFELFPDNLVDKAKVFYVAREVKDIIVSLYHLEQLGNGEKKEFRSLCLDFIEDRGLFGPYFTHLKEGWSKRNHPNVMFMFYEDIIKDIPGTTSRVSKFLGKSYSEEQLKELNQHLCFDNMKKNDAVKPAALNRPEYINKNAQPFIRQGKSGTWREYFDDELLEKTEAWIARNLADSDFKYPT